MDRDLSHLTLRQSEYSILIGETGSIARASEALNVSLPSISSAISQLEEELGFSFFVRKSCRVLLYQHQENNNVETQSIYGS